MGFKRLTPYKYSKLRRQIYERDEGQCVLCGGSGAHIHHIIFRSQVGKMSRVTWLRFAVIVTSERTDAAKARIRRKRYEKCY